MTSPLTMTLWVKLCLSSVRKELLSMMKDREDCIDLPADKSESWEMNLMIVS